MLVRGTTPHGEENLARARRLRRSLYVLFGAFLLLVLIAVPLFLGRFAQIIPPDDPRFIRQIAKADAIWVFRPGPMAERLLGDAAVPLDLQTGLSTLHQHGQVFFYRPASPDGAADWVLVMSRRRPQQVYDGALRRLFPLEEELHLDLATHLDRDRLVIASSKARLEAFLSALEAAGEVPKVEVSVLQDDTDLGQSYIARYRGEWGLLPKRFADAVVELTGEEIAAQTAVVVTCDRLSDMIAVTREAEDQPWIVLEGVGLTGEIAPAASASQMQGQQGRQGHQ
jgi:hypothetical protein